MASEKIDGSDTRGSSSGKGGKGDVSQDPEVLAAEIEATREDLAETLDAIADRVSPGRVAERGKQRLKEAAVHAKEVATEKAGVAKGVVSEKAAVAKDAVTEKAATARAAVQDKTSHGSSDGLASSVAVGGSAAATTATPTTATPTAATSYSGTADLPPVAGVTTPPLSPRPAAAPGGSPAASLVDRLRTDPQAQAVAGGVLVLLVALLLRRRSSD